MVQQIIVMPVSSRFEVTGFENYGDTMSLDGMKNKGRGRLNEGSLLELDVAQNIVQNHHG